MVTGHSLSLLLVVTMFIGTGGHNGYFVVHPPRYRPLSITVHLRLTKFPALQYLSTRLTKQAILPSRFFRHVAHNLTSTARESHIISVLNILRTLVRLNKSPASRLVFRGYIDTCEVMQLVLEVTYFHGVFSTHKLWRRASNGV